MSELDFSMRLQGSYEGEKNAIDRLEVEHRVDGDWQPLDLDIATPGFTVFVYAMLNCQHTYFRLNCAERGLLLSGAEGRLDVGTDASRRLESIRVEFTGRLTGGEVQPGDIDHIVSGMENCPVSRNLRLPADVRTTVRLA